MNSSNYSGILIRFLLYPLLFTTAFASEGVVVAIGVLLIYPLLGILSDFLENKIHAIESVYLVTFFGVLLGSLYILVVGMIDWEIYEKLKFVFPTSMTASALLLCWLDKGQRDGESTHFAEAMITAILIFTFSCLRDIFGNGTLDFRFGEFGVIYTFGIDVPFKSRQQELVKWFSDLSFSALQSRAMGFWGVMIFLAIIQSFKGSKNQ
ncbi:MAG: hypothetical protein ACRCS8_06390 [Brevinema sp.]